MITNPVAAVTAVITVVAVLLATTQELIHERYIIVRRQIPIFLKSRTFVRWHGPKQLLNNLVGNERVTEINLSDIWLFSFVSNSL